MKAQSLTPKRVLQNVELDTIQSNLFWLVDTTQQWTIDTVTQLNFGPFDASKGIPFNPYHTFWFKFSLENVSGTDALDVLLCTGDYSTIKLTPANNLSNVLIGGDLVSVHNRAFRDNELCFPIKINPSSTQNYFLSIFDFNERKIKHSPLVLKSYEKEKLERSLHHTANLPNYIFFGIFSGTLFILFFYASFQYKTTLDKAFLFYACYLLSIYIYNLKNFESEHCWPFPFFFSYFMELKRVLETNLEHFGYILYILFIQYFLNLSENSPKINKYLNLSIWFLAGYILLDYILQLTLGTRTSITIQRYVRSLFFIPAIALVYHIFFQQKNKLYRYIFIGSCFLLLSSFYTLLGQIFPFNKHHYYGGTVKAYEYEGYWLYMYNMKVGLLLEMICFAFGLSYKNSQQWKDYLTLNNRIKEQNQQIKKITYTPINLAHPEDELLQKIAFLLEKNLENADFGTQELANQLLMSRSKLARQLKKKNQPASSHIIRQFRLEKARNLILTTNLTFAEIAIKTGFKEASHFSKAFKDFYKIIPSELRLRQ